MAYIPEHFTWLRYIAYTAVIPRQTYSRGSLDNMAFFSQVWWPITIWGAARGPKWPQRPAHLWIHLLRYFRLRQSRTSFPPPELRQHRELLRYAMRSGLVFAIVIRIMHRASLEAEAEREAISRRLSVQEEERSIRRQELQVRGDAHDPCSVSGIWA